MSVGQHAHNFENAKHIGAVGYNWHGSFPVFIADAKFEPNFRQFNMIQDISFANEDLHNKLMKNDDGKAEYVMALSQYRGRGYPILLSSAAFGGLASWFITRTFKQRSTLSNPWMFVRCTGIFAAAGCYTRYWFRERAFKNDFERNQYFAYEEIKARRDEERVRKALEAKDYTSDPLTEYRVKAWQVSRAGL